MINRLRNLLTSVFPALEHESDFTSCKGALVLLNGYATLRPSAGWAKPEFHDGYVAAGSAAPPISQHGLSPPLPGEILVGDPASLAARARLIDTGHGRETDHIDAHGVALVAAQRLDLAAVGADDHTRVLRLHRRLCDLIAGGVRLHLSAVMASDLLAKVRPGAAVETERKWVPRGPLADSHRLDKAIAENRRRCATAVAASGTSLIQITGISDVLAAKILVHVGDLRWFPNSVQLASYAGTALIETSSGDVTRHRLCVAQTRQLNYAIHLGALVKTIFPGPGRDYYQRSHSTGSSRTEALRLLKLHLTKAIYRTVVTDAVTHPFTVAA